MRISDWSSDVCSSDLASTSSARTGVERTDKRASQTTGLFALSRGLVVAFGTLQGRRGDDGRDGEVGLVMCGLGALGQLHGADVDRIADFQPGQIDDDNVRNIGRLEEQFDLMRTAGEHALRKSEM